ncbi:MAG: hypothetical protein KDN18_25245 [Verrucomicrobiae bacterium]|nr:hypothetical protein [Verrucomicrobiae bacterium]
MKPILVLAYQPVRLALAALMLAAPLAITSCTTTDVSEDSTIYPTPAEKNHQLQEQMSQMTRSYL